MEQIINDWNAKQDENKSAIILNSDTVRLFIQSEHLGFTYFNLFLNKTWNVKSGLKNNFMKKVASNVSSKKITDIVLALDCLCKSYSDSNNELVIDYGGVYDKYNIYSDLSRF